MIDLTNETTIIDLNNDCFNRLCNHLGKYVFVLSCTSKDINKRVKVKNPYVPQFVSMLKRKADWDWTLISKKIKTTHQIILTFKDKWDWKELTLRTKIDYIKEQRHFPWDWYSITKHIDSYFIYENPHLNWDYEDLSLRRSHSIMTLFILYPDKPWNITSITNTFIL